MADQFDADLGRVFSKLKEFEKQFGLKVTEKRLLRDAGDIARQRMKGLAPIAEKAVIRKKKTIKPGGLRRSIKWLNLKRTKDVFVGPDYRIAPHAHLAEYGFIHAQSGEFVKGSHYGKKTYEQTKGIILENLKSLAKDKFEEVMIRLEDREL